MTNHYPLLLSVTLSKMFQTFKLTISSEKWELNIKIETTDFIHQQKKKKRAKDIPL